MNMFLFITVLLYFCCQQTYAGCEQPHRYSHVVIDLPKNVDGIKIFKEMTIIHLRCTRGYLPNNDRDSFIFCSNGKWRVYEHNSTRLAKSLTCKKKNCPVIKPENGDAKLRNNNVTYTCKFGYKLKGANTALCKLDKNDNFYVTAPPPVCEEIHQCKKQLIPNLIYDADCCLKSAVYRFKCQKNFRLRGANILTCDENGNWNGVLPTCQPIPKCVDPGNINYGTRKGHCCDEGSVIEYNCTEGYEFLNEQTINNKIRCLSNARWSGSKPICKPIGETPCPSPQPEHNLEIESSNQKLPGLFLSEELVNFKCRKHYDSNSDEFSLLCNDDGLWDYDLPVCFPANPCSRPKNPKNGRIKELENNNNLKFEIDYEINFICDKGYRIPSGIYYATCLGNKWSRSIPDCVPITCTDPGHIENALRTGNDFRVGKVVTYNCMNGFQLIGTSVHACQENGRWTEGVTVCSSEVIESDCHHPGTPIHGSRQGDKFNIGDVVHFLCNPGYTLFGSVNRTCLKNGYWSGKQTECFGANEYSDYEEVVDSLQRDMTVVSRTAMETLMTMDYLTKSVTLPNHDTDGGVNLIFLLDASKSMSEVHFNQSKEFIKMVIKKVGISDHNNGVRAAVITFSSEVKDYFGTNVVDLQIALNIIDGIKFDKKGTNINEALKRAGSVIISGKKDSRKNSKSLIFLISDGIATEGGEPKIDLVRGLKRHGKIYAIGVGPTVNKKSLIAISDEFFYFENHNSLIDIVSEAIGKNIDFSPCGMERPTYNLDSGIRKTEIIKASGSSLYRIVGGHNVEGSWPWMVSFQLRGNSKYTTILKKHGIPTGHLCGGVIIHTKWVLSAAHCFNHNIDDVHEIVNSPRNWILVVGRTNISLSSALEYPIKSFISYPSYDLKTLDYDIALVQISSGFVYDYFTRPICLPPLYEELPKDSILYAANQHATVIGWGYNETITKDDKKMVSAVEYLNEASLPIQTSDVCQKPVECPKPICKSTTMKHPTERMLCAGSGLGGVDACHGDSGGPLMQQVMSEEDSGNNTSKQPRWFSIGIVSWGVGCGQVGHYGYFTHVSKLRSWINNETNVMFDDFNFPKK